MNDKFILNLNTLKQLIYLLLVVNYSFAQTNAFPLEEKHQHLINNPNYSNESFKDVNNVLDKFLGCWSYSDDKNIVIIEIFKFYDDANKQDALYVNIHLTKNGKILLNTLGQNYSNMINGGFFMNSTNINSLNMYFSEIQTGKMLLCGHSSRINLTFTEEKALKWEIELKELMFNETARLLPRKMLFIKS